MKTLLILLKYELFNVLRGKWLIFYALLFSGFSQALIQLSGDPGKTVLSLTNMLLLVVPIVSILFSSIYWYHSENFTRLLLTQPLRRPEIYFARWMAISAALSVSFLGGTILPFAWNGMIDGSVGAMLLLGVALTVVFVSIGLFLSTVVPDRMKGIGAAFLVWFYFAIVHDGLTFLVMALFREYPLEAPVGVLTAASPIALIRVSMLLAYDLTALMGYTGLVLQRFFHSGWGYFSTIAVTLVWVFAPLWLGIRRFNHRDF